MDRHSTSSTTLKNQENKASTKDIFFGSQRTLAFAYKKTERLSSAVYMVTEFVSDTEPLKWELRKKSLELISDIGELVALHYRITPQIFAEVVKDLYGMISLCDVAKEGRILSEMNLSILRGEFIKLVDFLDKEISVGPLHKNHSLSLNAFDIHDSELPAYEDQRSLEKDQISIKDIKDTGDLYSPLRSLRTQQGQKTASAGGKQASKNQQDNTSSRTAGEGSRSSRILGILLTMNRPASIKDISGSLSNVSEKTVQRELLALVAQGILKKEGERRWSRYSIVSTKVLSNSGK
jgi:hypothetical protein